MNRQISHLTDRQIDAYTAKKSEGDTHENAHIESHIAVCDSCRKRVLEAECIELGVLRYQPAKARSAACPDEKLLQEYASGLCTPQAALDVIHHASRCDFCAPMLRDYMEDLSGELSSEAKDFLERLPASEPNWSVQAHGIGRPAFLARLKALFFSFPKLAWPKIAIPAASLALVTFCAFVLYNHMVMARAEKLTVKAFVENPNTEWRYAWAPHTFDMKLSGESAPVAYSNRYAMHEAQPLADQNRNSSDPKWQRINGRLALLNGDIINAVVFLQRAYNTGLHDPETEIDLARAYFLRDTSAAGQKGQNATQNVSETINLLHKVLKEPGLTTDERASALFGLASAYEKIPLWDQAVMFWEQYLVLDPDGPWAEEARRRLAADRSKMQPPRPEGFKTPAFFESHSSDSETQDSIEEYQDAALRTWLLDLTGNRAAEASRAIRTLANVLEEQHDDPWLKDFLNSRQPGDWAGVQALSEAITSNRRGISTEAEDSAHRAEAIFERTGNVPGMLRARFEAMYADQRLLAQEACVKQAQRLDTELRGTAYRWLQVQTALTQGACLNRMKAFEAADEKVRIGYQSAIRFRFHLLELRAMALDAGSMVERDCDASWQKATAGLDLYWRGPSSPIHRYEFYSRMKQCLEKKNLWHAGEAMERRMIAILETEINREDRNVILEATAHIQLQVILKALNEPAPKIDWNVLQPDPVLAKYQLPPKLELADLQLRAGDAETALATVVEAKDLVESTKDDLIRLNFYRVDGDILLELHQLDAAEAAYTTGLEIGEQVFGNLKSGEKRLQWMKETGEIYRGMAGVLLKQDRKDLALQLWEWYRSRAWMLDADPQGDAISLSWPEIEREVSHAPIPAPAFDTRLIYAYIKDRVYIWTIGHAGVNLRSSGKITREQLQQRINDYAQEIGNENSSIFSLEEDSQRLFSLLLSPVLADLRESSTVVVELDPLMNQLMLEAIKSPEGWYLGQKYPVVYSPGLIKENDLRAFSHRPPASSWLLNALAADDQRIMDSWKGIKVLNALHMTMPELSDRLAESELFIFFGHGESGALQMPNRTPLRAEDFPPQSLQKLQLAALVACSSGSGRDGMMNTNNLVHALLAGGVPAVLASHWDVSRDNTKLLIGSFYDRLEKGETPARSMLEARQEVFRSGKSHPFYWAAFSLTGRTN